MPRIPMRSNGGCCPPPPCPPPVVIRPVDDTRLQVVKAEAVAEAVDAAEDLTNKKLEELTDAVTWGEL